MRYAIFSDIHGNLRAWEQVLADIAGQGADVLVCLGDVVGYGPKPEEVLNAIRGVTENFVLGNHDAAAAGAIETSFFNEHARGAIEWTIAALSEDAREFLASVPLAIEAKDMLFVHAEICEPGRFGYIEGVAEAHENFAGSDHFVTFVGHTHHPCVFSLSNDGGIVEHPDENRQLLSENRYIVNVGSVGEPRNPDDLRGRYVIYDSESRIVEFRGVSFDISAYRADLESTSLSIKPYFLQVFDHLLDETDLPLEGASRAIDMEISAGAAPLIQRRRGPAKLNIPATPVGGADFRGYAPPRPVEESKTLRTVLFVSLGAVLILAISLVAFLQTGNEQKSNTVVGAEPRLPAPVIENEVAPKPEPAVPPPAPAVDKNPEPKPVAVVPKPKSKPIPQPKPEPKPKPKPEPKPDLSRPNPLIAWWRMEPDSAGEALVDSDGNHPLPAEKTGTVIRGLAPEIIPANGVENKAALGIGVWTEPAPSGVFALRADRSFTFEGWVLTAKPRVPIFVAGTRSGDANDSQGWHVDIRPPSNEFPNGQMSFFYDFGPAFVQALSEDLAVADLKPHHFAAVWDHDAAAAAGAMQLYFEGDLVASTEVPHAKIPAEQANPFRIGALTNPPRIALDEIRFSHAALGPWAFLNELAGPKMVAYFPLNDGEAGTPVTGADDLIDDPDHPARDASVEGRGGTWVQDPQRGVVFSSTESDRLNLGTQGIKLEEGFSWSFWVKVAGSNRTDQGADVLIGTRNGDPWHKLQPNGLSNWANLSYQIPYDRWAHVAYCGDASGLRIYVDGKLAGEGAAPGAPAFNGKFELGGSSRFSENSTGLFSDLSIWKGVLSEGQIQALAAGKRANEISPWE